MYDYTYICVYVYIYRYIYVYIDDCMYIIYVYCIHTYYLCVLFVWCTVCTMCIVTYIHIYNYIIWKYCVASALAVCLVPTVAICLKIVVPGPVQRLRRHQGKASRGCRREALRTPRAGQWFHLCCGGCSLFAESSPYSDFQWLPMTSHDILIFLILLICLLQCGWQCLPLRPPNFRTASCKALVFHLNLLKVGDTAGLWSWHVIAWYVPWSKHRIWLSEIDHQYDQ